MRKFKNLMLLVSVFCMMSILMFNISVSAAENINSTGTENRQKDLDFLYENLKTYHPNIFANTPEKTFLTKKLEIESHLRTESDAEFVLDLQSLVALIGDSHTQMSINSIAKSTGFYPMNLSWFDGKWYMSTIESEHQDLLGTEVTAINGLSMEEVLSKFSKLISADNPIKLRRQFRQSSNVEAMYRYVGVINDNAPMTLTLKNAEGKATSLTLTALDAGSVKKLSVVSLSDQRKATPDTATKDSYYSAQALNSDTYYIQYNECAEDPKLPMKTFCEQIKADLDSGDYKTILVDLRNNGGGSDGVISPLLQLLRKQMDTKNTKVAALIGESTFSSAIINAVEIQEMGCALVGEATSGSVSHFGSVRSFSLPNSAIKVQVSSKYIDLGSFFDAAAGKGVEALKPDVEIPQTLTDYLTGRDSCIEKLLSDPTCLKTVDQPKAPLTRSRFVGMLYKAVGSPKQTIEQPPFKDMFGIEWYLPALNWAADGKASLGTGSNQFSGTSTLTWQEAAVFMVRSVKTMGMEPKEVRNSEPPESLLNCAWDKEAISKAWKWGLLPQNADFTLMPLREQGESMVNTLSQLK